MKSIVLHFAVAGLFATVPARAAQSGISLSSPGFPASQLDADGQLVEDWGPIRVTLQGEGLAAGAPAEVKTLKLDGLIPAGQARTDYGPVSLTLTAFRAPAFPAGVDLLSARLETREAKATTVRMKVALPENVRLGERTAQIGGRNVLLLPPAARSAQTMRDWGKPDEAVDVPALLAGQLNNRALQYVDVGGKADQSLYAGSDVEYDLTVPAGGLQLDFIAAPPQASVPQPNEMAWTPEKLRQVARDVWRDWR